MEAPIWKHRGTNDGYHKSVAAVAVTVVAEAVVAGCVVDVTVLEDVYDTEEG